MKIRIDIIEDLSSLQMSEEKENIQVHISLDNSITIITKSYKLDDHLFNDRLN